MRTDITQIHTHAYVRAVGCHLVTDVLHAHTFIDTYPWCHSHQGQTNAMPGSPKPMLFNARKKHITWHLWMWMSLRSTQIPSCPVTWREYNTTVCQQIACWFLSHSTNSNMFNTSIGNLLHLLKCVRYLLQAIKCLDIMYCVSGSRGSGFCN